MGRPPADVDPESPGGRLRAARLAAGLTLAQLAARLDCSYTAIAQIERGERAATLEWLRDAADALGVARSSLSADLADRPVSSKPGPKRAR